MDREVQKDGVPMTPQATRRAEPRKRTNLRAGAWLLMACSLGASAAAASCTVVHGTGSTGHTATTSSSGGGMTGTGGMGGGGGGPAITGRSVFESTVLDGMMSECGACHGLGGIADAPFLAAPDVYVSITTWPGVV